MENIVTEQRLSTRQLLDKIPNYPGLYRHSVNETYYGIKKIAGKRKEHSLGTTDTRVCYDKLKHGVKLTDWIIKHSPADFEELCAFLKSVLQK